MKNVAILIFAISVVSASLLTGCKPKTGIENSELLAGLLTPGCDSKNHPEPQSFSADGIGINMIYVPPKSFYFSSSDSRISSVDSAYWMGKSEITYMLWNAVKEWASDPTIDHDGDGLTSSTHGDDDLYAFATEGRQGGESGATCSDGLSTGDSQHPVTCVSWRSAMVWTNALTEWVNAKTGSSYELVYYSDLAFSMPHRISTSSLSTDYTSGSEDFPFEKPGTKGFRLPTTFQWRLASLYINDNDCDGKLISSSEFYPDNYASGASASIDDLVATNLAAVFDENGNGDADDSTAAVQSKLPNSLGLYDLTGNVFEWGHNSGRVKTSMAQNATMQGGAWNSLAGGLVSTYTYPVNPHDEYNNIGFRVARSE